MNEKKSNKFYWILGAVVIVSLLTNWSQCNSGNEKDSLIEEIAKESKIKAMEHEGNASELTNIAESHRLKAEEYKNKMRESENSAAEKDALIAAERAGRLDAEKQLEIIKADPPCKDFNPEEIDFDDAIAKILNLCELGKYHKEVISSQENEINLLDGKNFEINKSLSSCKKMASEYQAEAAANGKAADERLKALNKYKSDVVPALEKELNKKSRRGFWKRMRDYLAGAGIAAIFFAIK